MSVLIISPAIPQGILTPDTLVCLYVRGRHSAASRADDLSADPWPASVLQGSVGVPVQLPAVAAATIVGADVSAVDIAVLFRGAAGNGTLDVPSCWDKVLCTVAA